MAQQHLQENLTQFLQKKLKGTHTSDEDELTPESEAKALIEDARRERASDIHLDPQHHGVLVRLRIDGVIHDCLLLSDIEANRIFNQFKTMARINPVPTFAPVDGRITYKSEGYKLDLRVAIAPCLSGEKMSIRLLDLFRIEQKIDELGLDDRDLANIQGWLDNVHGLFIVTGPTGSGKTTTLYALLHSLKKQGRSIITIENPVEYEIEGVNQIQVDEYHGLTFAEGIKSMLRLDPDYLLLGEIRDAPSARAAINAASSGHVLMTTLHSRDAVGALSVLHNFGLDAHEISANLVIVVAQRLIRKLCQECRIKSAPTEETVKWFQSMGIDTPEQVWLPQGCEACSGIGYKERTGVFEIWQIDKDDYALILAGTDEHKIHDKLHERGHVFLLDDALNKAKEGITSFIELRTMGGFGLIRSNKKQ